MRLSYKLSSYQAYAVNFTSQFKKDLINIWCNPTLEKSIHSIFIAELNPIPKETDRFHFIC